MTKKFITGTLFCFIFNIAFGQSNDPSAYKFSSGIYDHIKKDSGYWRGGGTSSDLSFIGLYNEALAEYDKPGQNKKIITQSESENFMQNYKPVDAKEFIIKKAKENQIMIFNEAHYNPRDRVFVTSLLQDLKDMGYKYFAAETFINNSSFKNNKHPCYKTGYYSMEPEFGNLIREAVKLNFSLYPYEDTTGADGKQREIREARNLQSLIKKEPKVKIIIYCGFGHIVEDSLPGWEKAMAGRLREFTGINPYTVDQVVLSERSQADLENPYFRIIHSVLHINKYSIFINEKGESFNNHKVDALLYSPPTKYVYNRPDWIFENNKIPYFLNPNNINIPFPIIVKAYFDTDNLERSIPIDIIEIKDKSDILKTAIALYQKGHFIINIINKNGETQTFKVDE